VEEEVEEEVVVEEVEVGVAVGGLPEAELLPQTNL
jgi:hypothetical protein